MVNVPVVLAHGIFPFDKVRQLVLDRGGPDIGPHYFVGIADYLRANGFAVLETNVSFVGSVAHRAQELARQVIPFAEAHGGKVQIIAHSMGGLDARDAIVSHGLDRVVQTLTTIGTPHHGSPLALLSSTLAGEGALDLLSPWLDTQGFDDLQPAASRLRGAAFAEREATNRVRYRAVHASKPTLETRLLLQPTSLLLRDSDGVVPVESQKWAETVGTKQIEQIAFRLPADHLNEIGVPDFGLLGPPPAAFAREIGDVYLHLARTASTPS